MIMLWDIEKNIMPNGQSGIRNTEKNILRDGERKTKRNLKSIIKSILLTEKQGRWERLFLPINKNTTQYKSNDKKTNE